MTRRGVLKAFTGVMVAVVLLVAACAGWIAWITRDQRPAILRGLDRSLVISEQQAPDPGMRIPNTLPELTHRILKDHPIGSDGSRLASDLQGMGFRVFGPEGNITTARFDSSTSLFITWIYRIQWREDRSGRITGMASAHGATGL